MHAGDINIVPESIVWEQCIQRAIISDVGMRRTSNQDAFTLLPARDLKNWRERGHLFLVADGMGAHAGGELASRLAADGIPHTYYTYRDKPAAEAIRLAIVETNAQIHQRGAANSDFHNMGTTASVLLLLPEGAVVGHVGDSRVYRLRQNQLDQITFDHSLLWEMKATGKFPKDADLESVVPKNVITRSIGPNENVEVDLEGPFPIEMGDTFLLCSDGLTAKIEDEELGALLASLDPEDAVRVLVDLANLRGGPDNITVLVVKVTGDALTTSAAGIRSAIAGRTRKRATVNPVLWVIMGICALAAGVLYAGGRQIEAVLAVAGSALAGLLALIQKLDCFEGNTSAVVGEMLGKGPHRRITCPPTHRFVAQLDGLAEELKEAADHAQWGIDFSPFDGFCDAARTATRQRDYRDAVRQYGLGISHVMEQLRKRRRKQEEDASSADRAGADDSS